MLRALTPETEGLLAWAGGWLCRFRGSRLGTSDAPTATVAPHQKRHDERPRVQENLGYSPGNRVEEADVGHHQSVDDPCNSRGRAYPPQPAGVDTAQRYSQPIENEGEPQQDVRVALKGVLG